MYIDSHIDLHGSLYKKEMSITGRMKGENRAEKTDNDNSKIDELIELIKKLIDKDDNTPMPIYIGNELIDEYILNKNSRTVLRSGGRA